MREVRGSATLRRSTLLVAVVVALIAAAVVVTVIRVVGQQPAGSPRPSGIAGERALPLQQPPLVRLAVAGDTGTGDPPQLRTVAAMQSAQGRYTFDGVLLLGDMVYDVGDPALVDDVVTDPFAPLVQGGADLIPVLGNHDVESGRQGKILRLLGETRSYYVQEIGSLRIIVLDSNEVDDAQTAWLRRVLSRPAQRVRWTIAAMHHPAYSAGEHGSDIEVREAWTPLFEKFDVPLVLAGHDHDYQRSQQINGVTYVVSGGGAKLRDTGSDDFTEVSESVLHFLDVAVYRDHIAVRAIDQQGNLVDRFVVN
jgi:3',5'-cyclic AMP phosphodiesterase CpdA